MKVEPVPLPVRAVVPGTVISTDRVEVASRLTGYIHGLDVHEGQTVKKGQLLLGGPDRGGGQIRQAKAEVAEAKATLTNARANYERYKVLYQQRAAAGKQYQEMEMAYKVAQEGYQAAQAALAAAQAQLKYAQVHAPFDGLVVSKLVDNGQLATPGTPLLVLENPNHLQVQAQVPEQALPAPEARSGDARFSWRGPITQMHSVTGAVERLVAAADPVTHTHLVKIGLPAESGAYSGEYALVNIPVGEQEGIVVPDEAIHTRAGITGVFVVDAGGRAQFRMVTLGERLPEERWF